MNANQKNEEPLSSWKEIGAYLQRNEATARRWEREEGLPVHRHTHKSRSSVYAYPTEIDAWKVSRKVVPEPAPARPLWKIPAFALTMLLCLVMVGNGIRPVAAQQTGGVAKRLICEGACADNEANLSPDGRLTVMTDWDTGDLAVRDMSTGKMKGLRIKADSFKESSAYGENPVFSPDTRQIVYHWSPAKDGPVQLRLTPNDSSGKWRVLVDNPEFEYYEPEAWSQDGKSVLVLMQKTDKTWQLAWVSAADGTVKQIVSLGWRIRGGRMRAALSADGRYIAYAALAVNPRSATGPLDSTDAHIYVVAADGSSGAELVKTTGINNNPTWTPNGKHLLFTSDRSGSLGLWAIAMQNGKPAGSPKLVRADTGDLHVMGMRSGSYYYTQTQSTEYISIATLDGKPLESYPGIRPAWSPDGKSIAFKKHHPGNRDGYDLVVRSLETGEERVYTTKLGITRNQKAHWFHDGGGLLEGINAGGVNSPYRVDLKTGEFKPIPSIPSIGTPSPDGKTLYLLRRDSKDADAAPDRIVAVDIESGRERQVSIPPVVRPASFALSPDGRTLALIWNDLQSKQRRIARVAVDGTGYRELSSGAVDVIGNELIWSPDGRRILFNKRRDDKLMWQIVWVPADGGTPQLTGVEIDDVRLQGMELSPDGSRLAYASTKGVAELWALDNLLSTLK